MSEQHFDEQKVIIPSTQGLEEIDRVDKTKVFWTVVLAFFIVSFVFILGYWVGQQRATADYFKIMPNNSVDVTPLVGMNDNTGSNMDNVYAGDNLEALDSAAASSTPAGTLPSQTITTENDIAPMDTSSLEATPPVNTNPVVIKQKPTDVDNTPIKPVIKPSNIAQGNGIIPHLKNSNGKWAVRMVTVKNEQNAIALKNNLAKMGYHNINMLKIGVLYRVSALGFESQKDARDFQNQIKKKLKLTDTLIIKL